jgi:hypothetical protein
MYKFIKKRKYPYFLVTYEEIHTEPVRVLRRLEKNLRLPPLGEVWLQRYVSMLRVYSASRASPVVGGLSRDYYSLGFIVVCVCVVRRVSFVVGFPILCGGFTLYEAMLLFILLSVPGVVVCASVRIEDAAK